MKAKLIKTPKDSHHNGHYFLNDDNGFAIGSSDKDWCKRAVTKKPLYVLSLKNCQAIERGYDLDELAYEKSWNEDSQRGFISGAMAILELMGDKKFSENDVLKVVTHVFNELVLVDGFNKNYLFPESIYQETTTKCKSMQQKEWDVEVIMEYVKDETKIIGAVKRVKGSGHKITTYKETPKLDEDGYLILKRKS